MFSARTAYATYRLEGNIGRFEVSLETSQVKAGVDRVKVSLRSPERLVPPELTIVWTHPAKDIQASWHPATDRNKSFKADWMKELRSNAVASAPVYSLYNSNGDNRLTFALSDALHTAHYSGFIREETGEFQIAVKLFKDKTAPIDRYEAILIVDSREVPYYESLNEIAGWWASMPEYRPANVPDIAKKPMYSTWYVMHQHVSAASVEAECLLAKKLGMEAVIIDDGWQTSDHQRGYAYTGDWEPCPEKFPDMKAHADAVHGLGMKLLLWYAVPFVGKHSTAWNRFRNKLLRFHDGMGAGILDPRYPDVRDYIIGTYEDAIREWDLDGFKLDFVDQFYSPERETPSGEEGRDTASIPAAVDRLLSDAMSRLKALKPDVMVEFRQPYIGPAMRKYGNMFRASDCPNDAIQNRVRTIDIRLLCGDTAAHADMLMWHPDEPAESAALQLINSMFAVPQVSMKLASLPEDHRRMLSFWLAFAGEYRDVLLGGKLRPANPELLYPVVSAEGKDIAITVAYSQVVIPLEAPSGAGVRIIVNGTRQAGIYAVANDAWNEAEAVILDCRGDEVARQAILSGNGAAELPIPAAGVAFIHRNNSQAGRN